MESPGGTVVSKSDVFPISAQNICGNLHQHITGMDGRERKVRDCCNNREDKGDLRIKYTHTSASPCKDLSFFQQHFFCMYVMVDDDETVRAHHQRIRRPILPL